MLPVPGHDRENKALREQVEAGLREANSHFILCQLGDEKRGAG